MNSGGSPAPQMAQGAAFGPGATGGCLGTNAAEERSQVPGGCPPGPWPRRTYLTSSHRLFISPIRRWFSCSNCGETRTLRRTASPAPVPSGPARTPPRGRCGRRCGDPASGRRRPAVGSKRLPGRCPCRGVSPTRLSPSARPHSDGAVPPPRGTDRAPRAALWPGGLAEGGDAVGSQGRALGQHRGGDGAQEPERLHSQ